MIFPGLALSETNFKKCLYKTIVPKQVLIGDDVKLVFFCFFKSYQRLLDTDIAFRKLMQKKEKRKKTRWRKFLRYLFFDSILCKAILRGKSKLLSLKLEQSLKLEILEIGE